MLWTFLAVAFLASGNLAFDQRGVWDVRSHEVQKQFDAFMLARDVSPNNESTISQYTVRSQPWMPLDIMYYSESGDDNFLTTTNLEWMKEIEAKVYDSSFTKKCKLTQGVDTTQTPMTFVSLDPSTNTITASRAPQTGMSVIFSGSSSVLMDGGLYIVGPAVGGFKLMVRDLDLVEKEVSFALAGDISVGARFVPATMRCSASESLLAYAYPAPEEQTKSICDGFVPSQSVDVGGQADRLVAGAAVLVGRYSNGKVWAISAKNSATGTEMFGGKINEQAQTLQDPQWGTQYSLQTGDVIGKWCPSPPIIGGLIGAIFPQQGVWVPQVREQGGYIEVLVDVNAKAEFEKKYWKGILDAQGKADGGYY